MYLQGVAYKFLLAQLKINNKIYDNLVNNLKVMKRKQIFKNLNKI